MVDGTGLDAGVKTIDACGDEVLDHISMSALFTRPECTLRAKCIPQSRGDPIEVSAWGIAGWSQSVRDFWYEGYLVVIFDSLDFVYARGIFGFGLVHGV